MKSGWQVHPEEGASGLTRRGWQRLVIAPRRANKQSMSLPPRSNLIGALQFQTSTARAAMRRGRRELDMAS